MSCLTNHWQLSLQTSCVRPSQRMTQEHTCMAVEWAMEQRGLFGRRHADSHITSAHSMNMCTLIVVELTAMLALIDQIQDLCSCNPTWWHIDKSHQHYQLSWNLILSSYVCSTLYWFYYSKPGMDTMQSYEVSRSEYLALDHKCPLTFNMVLDGQEIVEWVDFMIVIAPIYSLYRCTSSLPPFSLKLGPPSWGHVPCTARISHTTDPQRRQYGCL